MTIMKIYDKFTDKKTQKRIRNRLSEEGMFCYFTFRDRASVIKAQKLYDKLKEEDTGEVLFEKIKKSSPLFSFYNLYLEDFFYCSILKTPTKKVNVDNKSGKKTRLTDNTFKMSNICEEFISIATMVEKKTQIENAKDAWGTLTKSFNLSFNQQQRVADSSIIYGFPFVLCDYFAENGVNFLVEGFDYYNRNEDSKYVEGAGLDGKFRYQIGGIKF